MKDNIQKIKVIIFDLSEVIINGYYGVEKIIEREKGIPINIFNKIKSQNNNLFCDWMRGKINEEFYFRELLKNTNLKLNDKTKEIFKINNIEIPTYSVSLYILLKRPEISINFIKELIDIDYSDEVLEEVEIEVKYEGYIAKSYKEAEKMLKLEDKQIPEDIDYNDILNLASEARQKLEKIRPTTLGQAARISGVNPSDLSILSIYLKREFSK